MIYQNPFRKWTVEVSDDPGFLGDHFEVTWRGTIRLGQSCELFSILSDRNPDDMFVQIMLFPDGSSQAWSWHPTMIQISPEEKYLVVGLLKPEDCMFDRTSASARH